MRSRCRAAARDECAPSCYCGWVREPLPRAGSRGFLTNWPDALHLSTEQTTRGCLTRKDGHATLSVDRAHGKAGDVAVPGDEIAAGAGDGSRLVASQADREQVLDALKAAF